MIVAKEEIFGPVMCVLKYKTTPEVIRRANDTRFGLGAGVVTDDAEEALQIIRELKSGTVYHNCYNVFSSNTPFGGYRDSGIGRELGEAGLNNYLELKTVIHNMPQRIVPEKVDKFGNVIPAGQGVFDPWAEARADQAHQAQTQAQPTDQAHKP